MSSEDLDFTAPMTFNSYQSNEETVADKFNRLASLNLKDKTESKNGLSYLSWANAWKAFKEVYPTATYKVVNNPQTHLPYFTDPAMGIMVFTEVTADGLTHSMWLPVMDSAHKAMKTEPYTYQVWDKFKKAYVEKKVEAATMFDINKTLMRCLVKNLAMFGLALYIYAGEDLPEEMVQTEEISKSRNRQSTDPYAGIKAAINSAHSTQALVMLYQQHQHEVDANPEIKALFTNRKQELLDAA